MQTILDKTTRDELIQRINKLNEKSTSQWGKLNIYQMLKHCTLSEELNLGKQNYKRVFIGRLFGKMSLNSILKDDKHLKRNSPTLTEFKITENGDVTAERAKLISLLEEYANFSNHNFVHPFFGKMTAEQVGYFVYKHTDHHLRQFNS
jgi:Protein of unknown function (DUF1569)